MTAAAEEARPPRIAAVVIGRNEGERLRRCLDSMVGSVDPIVYVDSGSTDGSAAMARGKGVDVVALDLSRPFTAARARNEGFRRVLATHPETDYVQFVDGDCEVQPGWLALGRDFLGQHPEVAAVCGWRQERKPQESVYNLLCDIEWKVPPGPAKACGGDVMMRAAALDGVGGYRDDLIAGEEPELCVRLRAKGWGVHVLGVAMTLHDAAMTRFSQWWMRNVRAGFALAEGAHLHGAPPERHCVRELRRALVWGLGLPLVVLCATLVVGAGGLGLLAIYPLQVARLYVKAEGDHRRRLARATFLTLAKFPEVQGALRYWRLKTLRRSGGLIEYK